MQKDPEESDDVNTCLESITITLKITLKTKDK